MKFTRARKKLIQLELAATIDKLRLSAARGCLTLPSAKSNPVAAAKSKVGRDARGAQKSEMRK